MREIKLKTTYLASIILVAVLTTSIFAAIFVGAAGETTITETSLLLTDGSNPMLADLDMGGYNLTNADNLESTQLMGDYSYMIYVDPDNSSIYNAKAANGTICWSSTNMITVWENVRDNGLTAGRDYKETVLLTGDFSLTSVMTVESYTSIYIQGKITLANGVNYDGGMIENSDLTGDDQIEIIGGILDGNDAQQTSYGDGLKFTNVTNLNVKNVEIQNIKMRGMWLVSCSNAKVLSNTIHDVSVYDGIWLRDCTESYTNYNLVYNIGRSGIFTEVTSARWGNNHFEGNTVHDVGLVSANDGILMENDERGDVVSGNIVYEGTGGGTMNSGIKWLGYFSTITANMINGTTYGIRISGGVHTITGNQVYYSGEDGIKMLPNTIRCTISGNNLQNCGNDAGDFAGIRMQTGAASNTITGNTINSPDLKAIIQEGTVTYSIIEGNYLEKGAVIVSTTDKISGNLGFLTENLVSGTNSTATTFVIAHSLAGTATHVVCSFNSTAIEGYSWTSDATNITVTVVGTLPAAMTCYADVRYVP